jgi:hypothetical protein
MKLAANRLFPQAAAKFAAACFILGSAFAHHNSATPQNTLNF